jgi:adenosylcobinamide amidohydrolase
MGPFRDVLLDESRRLLVVPFAAPCRALSWALVGGGRVRAERAVWLEVRHGDLESRDAAELFDDALAAADVPRAGTVGLMTGRAVARFVERRVESVGGEGSVRVVVTCGLGNALAAGDPPGPLDERVGTINLLVEIARPLGEGALVEAVALATEARTAALLAARVPSRRTGRPSTGTGTDCTVVAAREEGGSQAVWVGKHTALGAAIGAAVEEATAAAVAAWIAEQGPRR